MWIIHSIRYTGLHETRLVFIGTNCVVLDYYAAVSFPSKDEADSHINFIRDSPNSPHFGRYYLNRYDWKSISLDEVIIKSIMEQ